MFIGVSPMATYILIQRTCDAKHNNQSIKKQGFHDGSRWTGIDGSS